MVDHVLEVLEIRHGRIGSDHVLYGLYQGELSGPRIPEMAQAPEVVPDNVHDVHAEIEDRDERSEPVQAGRRGLAAHHVKQPLGPIGVEEFQRHSGDHAQQEAENNQPMQEPVQGLEADILFLVLSDPPFCQAEILGVAGVELCGSKEPQDGVDGEKSKGADEQGGHEPESVIEEGVIPFVGVIGVDDIAREVLIGVRVALAADLDPLRLVDPRGGVFALPDFMMAMAVIARRHSFTPQCQGLAVKRVAVIPEPVHVALPAHPVALEVEFRRGGCVYLVRGMAGVAHRRPYVVRLRQLAVNALVVNLLHQHVALAAGFGDLRPADFRFRVVLGQNLVAAVAVVAGRGHNEALGEQGPAVDRIHEVPHGHRFANGALF